MKEFKQLIGNEDGSLMMIVLLILVLLTLYGITSINTTVVEQQIAANEQTQKIAFYNSEGGIYAVSKLVENTLVNSGPVTITGKLENYPADESTKQPITYYLYASTEDPSTEDAAQYFYREITGFNNWDEDNDIQFNFDNHIVEIDVKRTKSKIMAGGGVEFASASEGIGSGTVGSAAMYYVEHSHGVGPRNSRHSIKCTYRKVIGQ